MISTSKKNEILDALVGNSAVTQPTAVFMGLSAVEPAKDGTISGEPTSIISYKRVRLGGSGVDAVSWYFEGAEAGVIKNSKEIQFQSARETYPNKIYYWFLSIKEKAGEKYDAAYMWGKIKKIMVEKQTFTGVSTTIVLEDAVELIAGNTYIISFNDKDYELQAFEAVIDSDNDSTGIGFETGDGLFSIIIGNDEKTIQITTTSVEETNAFAIYESGIEVKKATVPTFYEGELEISFDEEKSK